MGTEERRKYERVSTTVKMKLPGDTEWTDCTSSNISAGGLFFESNRRLEIGDNVTMQFMLHSKTGTAGNVHFIVSARVIRIIPYCGIFQIAVEFVIEEDVRKEILKLVELIKSQNLKIERPTTLDAVLHKKKEENKEQQ
ncbi:MAG TPA: PilZ domain-containing protein [Dissulfurispiraceae bacterium]|nr:PilZ domain-containing protein [Dissulfurispiraceae bacterium]